MTKKSQTVKILRNVRRKDERPGEIIQAALEEFSINGYAATRLDDVAERAGICKGTIYLYFNSKEELFHAMVRHWILPQLEKIEQVGKQPVSSAEDILREQLRIIYEDMVSTNASCIPKLIISEGTRFPELAEFYYKEIIIRAHEAMREIVKRGVATGEFRPSALKWQLHAILSPALTAALWKSVFNSFSPLDLKAYFQTHVDLLLHGLKGKS